MRRVGTALLSVALLGAAVGCGSQRHAAATSVAEVRAKLPPKRTGAWVHVTVVDGDRGTRVPGAFVRIGRRARITDRRGGAPLHLHRPAPLLLSVKRHGLPPPSPPFPLPTH